MPFTDPLPRPRLRRARLVVVATVVAAVSVIAGTGPAQAQGTRFLRQPDVSDSRIVFVHANDLWTVGRDGGTAIRLTSSAGAETNPAFSPDGRWIAFSGQYEGNVDVYRMPAAGGQPERLTWHPAPDVVQGWTPDGAILFESSRDAAPPPGSRASTRSRPRAASRPRWPCPRRIGAACPATARTWRTRRPATSIPNGAITAAARPLPVSIASTATWERMTPPWEGERQMDPIWLDGVVYYLSERDWASNVWSFDLRTGDERQLTRHADFDVKSLGAGAGVVVYEQAGVPARARSGVGPQPEVGDPHRGRHELVATPLGGRPAGPPAGRTALPHRQARALRVARRALHRSGGRRLVAQPDPQPGRRGSQSGLVAGRNTDRLVQRCRRGVRPRRRRAERRKPAPLRHRRAFLLLPPRMVTRRREAGVHRHPLPRARPGRRLRRGRARRHRPLRASRALDEPRLVARLALDRLRPAPRQPAPGRFRARHRIGGDAPAHRRNRGRDHARVGRLGQAPLLSRIDELRPQHRLARHDVLRPPGDARPLRGAAPRRRAVALPAPKRRGRGGFGRRRGCRVRGCGVRGRHRGERSAGGRIVHG